MSLPGMDKIFEEAQRIIDKVGTEDMSTGDYKKGRFTSGQWANIIGAGFNSRGYMSMLNRDMASPSFKGREQIFRKTNNKISAATYGANAAASYVNSERNRPDDYRPPAVGAAPGQGAGVTEAERNARARAIQQARGRFGFRQTINTSPLGIQGLGAATGKRRLIGE